MAHRAKGNKAKEMAAKKAWRIPMVSFDPREYLKTVRSGVQRNVMQSKL
ncbi:hypothetical protein RAB80_016921 [Fusarium oxysporum f. sp. vasinfectum]|nr:hypothetical protein RAB80_016921 [Fusarium oxysporum f. sp. vasinfectum]